MRNQFIHLIGLSIFVSILAISCHHANEPTGPTPGKRDYTWKLDSLSLSPNGATDMRAIWASSPKDVYVVGDNYFAPVGIMYHYDGNEWHGVSLSTREGGLISGGFYLNSIFGFSASNIYADGTREYNNPNPPPSFLDSSIIIRYDGTAWTEEPIQKGRSLYTIWGINPQDIWAGGSHGTLYHYNGAVWNKMQFDTTIFFNSITGFASDDIYATCGRSTVPDTGGKETYFLYHWNGSARTSLDSFYAQDIPWKFGLRLWVDDNHNLYSSTYGVYRYQTGNTWQQLLDNDWPLVVNGSSTQNIFAVGDQGRIYEWNGTDWMRFLEIEDPQIQWMGVWTNNVETFIVGINSSKSYVLHGY